MAIGPQAAVAFDAQSRLQGSGFVIDTGMKHPAVAAARMETGCRFFIDDKDRGLIPSAEFPGYRDADDAGAGDEKVVGRVGHETRPDLTIGTTRCQEILIH